MTALRRRVLSPAAALLSLVLVVPGIASAAPTNFTGRLIMAHGDDFGITPGSSGQRHSTLDYRLITADGELRLAFVGGAPEGFMNGAQVSVEGLRTGSTVAVSGPSGGQVLAPAPAAATGSRKIALVLVNFTTNTTQPWTPSQAAGTLFSNPTSVANYFTEESYGTLSVTGDVFGFYTINFDTTGCNFTDLATKAKAAAAAASVDLSTYTNIQYAFPWVAACGWAGLAYLPGTESWINNYLQLSVSAHELSHNFGVHHASTLNCTESGVRVSLSATASNCTASEYGDPFSVMGNGSKHTHSQQLATLGWATGSALETVTAAGDYPLGAADDPASAIKAIRVARGDGTYLYLELREPWGTFDTFSTTDPAVNGVSIRIANDWTTIIQSRLIDTTPGTATFSDAPLAVGANFTDPLSTASFTAVSIGSGSAVVHISWGPDSAAPSTPGSLAGSVVGSTDAHLSWTASTDNVGVAGYRVSRDGNLLVTVTGTTYDDSGLSAGTTYAYAVAAFDATGNTSAAATKSVYVPIPDTVAPSAPTNLRTTSLTKAKATFAWNASTDNVGVAGYRIYRNGALAATTTALTWSDGRQRVSVTYYVIAFDAAGNPSTASNPVTVLPK
jgi:chitodextrinase